jgi:ParB family transcriptional regulator, chromosome partitioning protein
MTARANPGEKGGERRGRGRGPPVAMREAHEDKMAQIKEVKEIPLEQLVMSKEQVRVRNVESEISELAQSIRVLGLLEPVIVCAAGKGKYEILSGQRRFLACKILKRKTILAAVLDQRVDESQARAISLTENVMRRDLSQRELIDACSALYKKYGSIKGVAEATGLPAHEVSEFVKYDRLLPEMKKLVDSGQVDVKLALRAQDFVARNGALDAEAAVQVARDVSGMTRHQQKAVFKRRLIESKVPITEIIRQARHEDRSVQVLTTLSSVVHDALRSHASALHKTQDETAALLIEEALTQKGYMKTRGEAHESRPFRLGVTERLGVVKG